jgi:uncharacterized protein
MIKQKGMLVWGAELVSLALALSGCAAPPPRYYTLATPVQISANMTGPAVARQQRVCIEVMPVVVPERLNRHNLMFNKRNGSLQVLEQERWLVPFPDELRDAMSQRLQAELHAIDTYHQGTAGLGPCYRISVEVVQFDSAPGTSVDAVLNWRVQALPDGTPIWGRTTIELPVATGMHNVIDAYQQLVVELADDIAVQVRELQR